MRRQLVELHFSAPLLPDPPMIQTADGRSLLHVYCRDGVQSALPTC
jgi:hypothetical protein